MIFNPFLCFKDLLHCEDLILIEEINCFNSSYRIIGEVCAITFAYYYPTSERLRIKHLGYLYSKIFTTLKDKNVRQMLHYFIIVCYNMS